MSAVLELVVPSLEECESYFAEDLAALEETAVGVVQAAALEGDCGYIDHFLQVRGRTQEVQEAAERMQATIALLSQHPEYSL